jgi:DNA-binding response OmpR family regulator
MHSYETLVEFNGPAAFAAAATHRPDAVLLDIGLPGLSGLELCERIRREPWGTAMMIIAVTGWAREDDRVSAREAGFDHYVLKPANIEALDALLKGIDRRDPGTRWETSQRKSGSSPGLSPESPDPIE